MVSTLVDGASTSRDLIRQIRVIRTDAQMLPESVAWQTFLELERRGEPGAVTLFLDAVKNLHSRRCIAGAALPTEDPNPDEHRLTEDGFLADLWKAYKKCIRNNRTGPARQLLADMEEHLVD